VRYRSAAIVNFALMKSLIMCVLLLSVSFATGQMSHTCKFTRGPLQGQTHTLPNRSASAVGSTCSDGLTSSGIAVSDPDTPETSEPMSHTCKFNLGPLQGQTHTLPNRSATRVGSTCSDGLTSIGVAVPDPDGETSSERTSHTCRLTRGPLRGQTQTLPNQSPTKVGSTCSDGLTSSGVTGVTVAEPHKY
jgi:hypothetical protein